MLEALEARAWVEGKLADIRSSNGRGAVLVCHSKLPLSLLKEALVIPPTDDASLVCFVNHAAELKIPILGVRFEIWTDASIDLLFKHASTQVFGFINEREFKIDAGKSEEDAMKTLNLWTRIRSVAKQRGLPIISTAHELVF